MVGFLEAMGRFLAATGGPLVHGTTWALLAVVLAVSIGAPLARRGKRRRDL